MMCLAAWLEAVLTPFHVTHYVTFRAVAVSLSSFFIVLMLMPAWIRFLTRQSLGQMVRQEGPASHHSKQGTPTMGGVLMIAAAIVALLFWGDCQQPLLWVLMGVTVGFAIIGGIDDWSKIVEKNTRGLSAKEKLLGQLLVAGLAFAFCAFGLDDFSQRIVLPFFKDRWVDLGWLFWCWGLCVVLGSSNAVNLTLFIWPLSVCPLFGLSVCARRLRSGCFCRRHCRCRFGFFMVQHASSTSIHGRYGLLGFGGCIGHDGAVDSSRNRFLCHVFGYGK